MSSRLAPVRNVAKALLVLLGIVAAFTALGWWLGGFQLASVFCVIVLLIVTTIHWYGPRIVLVSLGASELPVGEAPLVAMALDRLAEAAGLRRPKLYVLRDGFPRSLAVGRSAGEAGIAVSHGLLTTLSPAEPRRSARTRPRPDTAS